MIKAIIFDLGGVLFTNGTKQFIRDISQRHDLDESLVKEVMDGDLGSAYREGKISRDEFWENALQEFGIEGSADTLENEWISRYELIEGTRDIILDLRDKYRIFYLSDNLRERVEQINDRFGFMEWFHGGIFSYEVGVRKPNPEIYRLALKKFGVQAQETIFIDDKQTALDPAQAMGMTAILFQDPADLKKKLQHIFLGKALTSRLT